MQDIRRFAADLSGIPMLEMRKNCETCQTPLGGGNEAFICSFECTFCPPCAGNVHKGKCPNCGGELVARPKREKG